MSQENATINVVSGDTVVVYGPQQFAGSNGQGQTYVERFTATVTPGRLYSLRLVNGAPDGTRRASKVVVKLNGFEIVSKDEVSQAIAELSRPVAVTDVDTLQVTVAGSGNPYITLSVVSTADSSFNVFGPSQFTVATGSSYSETGVLTSPSDAAAPYRVYVTNGASDGTDRATSASLTLNGVQIVSTSELTNTVGSLTKPVTLDTSNTYGVTVNGSVGSYLTVRFTATDTTRPVLTITAPAPQALTNQTSIDVTGAIADYTLTTVVVNGVAAVVTDNTSYTASVPLATEGENVITVAATDAAGRSTDSTRTVIRDTQAPSLSVTSPVDGLITPAANAPVSGTVSDAASVTVNVNGMPLVVQPGGDFAGEAALVEGVNVLTVTATDAATNSQSVVRTVTRDNTPPELIVATPADGAITDQASVEVSGTVSDATPTAVTVNGTPTAISPEGAFTRSVELGTGENTITVAATDAASNTTSVVRTVTRSEGSLPPDPATVAPPLDSTSAVGMFEATAFLYTGPNPIQTGVPPGTIVPVQSALLRGRVLTREGDSLPGVTVSVLGHSEYGQTLSRADGMFDMAVNGGGQLTVEYAKPGFLPAQRHVPVGWNEATAVPDVALVPLDSAVTTIDFSDPVEVARGSVVTDTSGTRQATLLFEQGTVATMVLSDGSVDSLPTVQVRATEYTVGSNGRTAMPGTLPPTSAYTYAAELTVDQAVAAGAAEVHFSKPVAFYLENFVGFPVGTKVPVGYYDRTAGVWRPLPDGWVIKILSITNGLADIDVNGSGSPSSSATLDSLGISDPEREQLAGLYSAEQTLWRTEHTHFSPFDWNWPAWQLGGLAPQLNDPFRRASDCPEVVAGSIIECENQVLGETIGLAGTGYYLAYRSSRVAGYVGQRERLIPLSGDSLPSSLKRIDLEVEVGGRLFRESFAPETGQRYRFIWDGLDAYGRRLSGAQLFRGRVGYVYDAVFQRPSSQAPSFGATSGIAITSDLSRSEVALWQEHRSTIGMIEAQHQGFGSWTLNVHHAYDPAGRVLYTGDGRRRGVDELSGSLGTFAGGQLGSAGDGGPAVDAEFRGPLDAAVGPDGSVYIADQGNHRIRRIGPDGIVRTVAGTGTAGWSGDGGQAVAAQIRSPSGVAVGADGSLYIVEDNFSYGRIRRVAPNGVISTIAGGGSAYPGDGGLATDADIYPLRVAVGPDGSIYFDDICRLRRVDVDGILHTVAGTGACGHSGDGGPAALAQVDPFWALTVGPDGSVFFLDFDLSTVRRIGTDGIITTVAGGGSGSDDGDGGPATDAQFGCLTGLAAAADGSLYTSDQCSLRIRRIGPDGIITTVAGSGFYGSQGDGGPAPAGRFENPMAVAVGRDGRLFVADDSPHRIREIRPILPARAAANILVASADGSEVYEFSATGRHLRTLHALTGATLLTFAYTPAGALHTVTDANGDVTTIERDGGGTPTAIVGPYGHRTEVTLDSNGYLASVTNPAGEITQLFHASSGLLDSLYSARGLPHRFEYDTLGRLIQDADPAGGSQTLARSETDSSYTVRRTTSLGRATSYEYQELSIGARRKVVTDPSGHSRSTMLGIDGSVETLRPDGSSVTVARRGNPRWGMQAPQAELTTVRMPSGLTHSTQTASHATVTSSGTPLSLISTIDSVTVNGKLTVSTYTAADRRLVTASPEGRQVIMRIDSVGRVLSEQVGGLDSVSYTYDSRGRLETMRLGGRVWTYSYDTTGRLLSTLDPLGRRDSLFYDDADRLTRRVLPGGLVIQFAYDSSGNLTSLTPPGRPAHGFGYTPVDLAEVYTPPNVGLTTPQTQYAYNLDRQLTQLIRPDSGVIAFGYDTAGRPSTVTFDRGILTYTYSPTTGQLSSLTAPGGQTLGFTYDGSLVQDVSWTGPVAGSVGVGYNNDFRVISQTLNGGDSLTFGYDQDGLLMLAGALGLKRDAQSGLLERDSVGTVKGAWSFNSRGELAGYTATADSTTLFQTTYTRDSLARITDILETVQGVTTSRSFQYDSAGRLHEVWLDSTLVASYAYDLNGNRLSLTAPGGVVTGTYDAQDRLTQYGSASYGYTSAGELRTKVVGSDTTFYTYDQLGNLTAVRLPDGTELGYVIDGQNRRVGKRVNGVLVQGFLYQSQLAPVAELDGAGQVVSRFVYATRAHVPDYMVKGGQTYRLILDHLGSVRLVVNTADGTVVQRVDYDEFGRVTQNTNPGFQPFGYAGGLLDEHTGLVRFGARDYDPSVGRWTAKDPIGFGGGAANLYAYVDNDPITYTDPSGLRRYGRCETEGILKAVRSNATGRKPGWWKKHAGGEDFDFKARDLYDDVLDDYYEVNGQQLRSDEFGNFAAGYAGIYGYGFVGYLGVMGGGIWYDVDDARYGHGTFDFDVDSWPAIHAGAWRALNELPWHQDGERRPSASEMGCAC